MCYELKQLYDCIRYNYFYGSGKNQFKVFTYEASLGKTTTMCDALLDLYKDNPNIHTLIVTKLKDEQVRIVKEKLGKIAKVINSDSKMKEETLCQYPILVITHAKYKLICRDIKQRKFYIKGRTNLIIDEQLDLQDIKEYSQQKVMEIRDIIGQLTHNIDLPNFWGTIIGEVNENLSNNYQNGKMKFVFNKNKKVIRQIDLLNQMIDEAIFPKKFINCESKWRTLNAIRYKGKIKNYIESIKCFFNNKNTIAYNGRLYAYNPKLRYLMLDNNIMLDASGKFLELYKISNLFKVIESKRIIPHNNTTLTFLQNNSTTNAIQNNDDYYIKLAEYIKVNTCSTDKVLIIGRRNDANNKDNDIESLGKYLQFEKDKIEFVNFDAMRGKNDWSDFNKCFIIHTPNRPFHQYPLQYLYYKQKSSLADDELTTAKVSTNIGFANETLEQLRITDVASSIYQGLKRINRNNDRECNYYVVLKDTRIQNILIEQFNNLKEVKYDKLIFNPKVRKDYDVTNRNADSYPNKFIELITTIEPGIYKKKDICNKLGMQDAKHFSDRVLTNEVKAYLEGHSHIIIKGQKIIINTVA